MRTYHKLPEMEAIRRSDTVRMLREVGMQRRMTSAGRFWVWYVVCIVVLVSLMV